MLLLDIERSKLFEFERHLLNLEQSGNLAAFAEALAPLASMLTGEDRRGAELAIAALSRDEQTPERRGSALYFTLGWLRKLQFVYRFLPTPEVQPREFAAFLSAAQREEKNTVGSEAVSLAAVAKHAKLPAEVVDRAAANAYEQGLIYQHVADEVAYGVFLEPEELAAALAVLDFASSASATDVPPVDVGIITIKDEEFDAVLGQFTEGAARARGQSTRRYNLRTADAGDGKLYRVAICRAVEQGNGEAQSLAHDMINDLSPALLLVVGIAGGVPSNDFSLGDVILSTRVNDYTVHAVNPDSSREYAIGGGPMAKEIVAHVADLRSYRDELDGWHSSLPAAPSVDVHDPVVTVSGEWSAKIRASLGRNFGSGPRAPRWLSGVIGSSDGVIKDAEVLEKWLPTARNLLAVEMETAGAFRATVNTDVSVLAVRGVSDIVGLKRDDGWLIYACQTAAAFVRAFLRTKPIPPQAISDSGAASARAGAVFAQSYRALSSPVASERAHALNSIERLLSSGANGGAALVDRLEQIALDRAAHVSDRTRAIQIMRAHTGVRPIAMQSLVAEHVNDPASSLFPTQHDSGPVNGLLTDDVQAMDVLLATVGDAATAPPLIARDALIAMAHHLRERPTLVGRERAPVWKHFAELHNDNFPAQAEMVLEQTDGKRLG